MNNDIEKLEIKVSYLEDYMNELNKIVIEQEKKIDRLIDVNRTLIDKVYSLEESIKDSSEETPPPHY